MDPEQTLRDCEAYLRDGDLQEAAEALAAYWGWRGKGGFCPPDGDRRARELARQLASAEGDADDEDVGADG
jgi:hypothetical protein